MRWWKTYTIMFGLLSFWGYAGEGFPRIWELIDYLIFLVSFAGLVSYSWKQRLFFRGFWMLFFPLMLLWNAYYMYFVPIPNTDGLSGVAQTWIASVSLLIFLPCLIAVGLYAYGSRNVWK